MKNIHNLSASSLHLLMNITLRRIIERRSCRGMSMLGIFNRVILTIFSAILIILLGCGDEEQVFPNPLQIDPLQIEILTSEEEESSPDKGSITGQIVFTDNNGQIQAHALSSNEYVIFQGASKRISGTDLAVFVDLPSNNKTYLLEGGYFRIRDVEPGTHEIILERTADILIQADLADLPEDNFAEVDVPTYRWTVAVEPGKNTTMGLLTIAIPDLEWKSGGAGQEIVVPQEPKPPVVAQAQLESLDIGDAAGNPGTTEILLDGTAIIVGAGHDIWGTADGFRYVYTEVSGDFEVAVQITEFERVEDWTKAGLMARQSVDPGAKNALSTAAAGANLGVQITWRPETNGETSELNFWELGGPTGFNDGEWIRLTRSGNDFSASWSDDGVTWSDDYATVTIEMDDPVLIGLAVTSCDAALTCRAVFENMTVDGIPIMKFTAVSPVAGLFATWGEIRSSH
jgi:regulation of enolase protein 1 (concanavalin A-like superfamily)